LIYRPLNLWQKRTHACAGVSNSSEGTNKKGGRWLKFSADVRVDFAIQADFFKRGCCPLHDHFTSDRSSNCLKRSMIVAPSALLINMKNRALIDFTNQTLITNSLP
jgi:hypothetical protein